MPVTDKSEILCQKCLQRSSCFNLLIPEELEFINQNKEQITYQEGETICKQGAFANYVMYVADGLTKTYLETVDEKKINLRIIKNSEFIGFSTLCGKKNYNYLRMVDAEYNDYNLKELFFTTIPMDFLHIGIQ